MRSASIIEDIDRIYHRFTVPPPIQDHMRRVAGVAAVIIEHWNGPSLDEDVIIAECLLHDLGNILKVSFDSELDEELYDETEHWEEVKADVEEQYGSDSHEATLAMAAELDVSERLYHLLDNAEFLNTDTVVESNDWELKICTYSDQRVAPHGVVSMAERLDEASDRYDHDSELGVALEKMRPKCQALEDGIFRRTNITPDVVAQNLKELTRSWLL